jgi:hypothetical protein
VPETLDPPDRERGAMVQPHGYCTALPSGLPVSNILLWRHGLQQMTREEYIGICTWRSSTVYAHRLRQTAVQGAFREEAGQ